VELPAQPPGVPQGKPEIPRDNRRFSGLPCAELLLKLPQDIARALQFLQGFFDRFWVAPRRHRLSDHRERFRIAVKLGGSSERVIVGADTERRLNLLQLFAKVGGGRFVSPLLLSCGGIGLLCVSSDRFRQLRNLGGFLEICFFRGDTDLAL
jgi:hypothetical protein